MKKALTVVLGLCFMHLIPLLVLVQKVQAQSKAFHAIHCTIKDELPLSQSYRIFQDNQGYVWIRTQDGLNRFDGNQFKVFKNDSFDNITLTHRWVWPIREDRNGGTWMGKFHCLCKYIRREDSFGQIYRQAHYSTSISENMPNYILRDKKDRLWISSFDSGLNLYNEKTNKFTKFKNDPDDQQLISDNAVHTLLWTDTTKVLVFYDDQSKIFHPYQHESSNPLGPSGNSVYALMEDRNSRAWVSGKGLDLTWWFIASLLLISFGTLYAAHRYRLEHSLKVERLRNKIASDLHDEVGSSLTRISIYSDLLQNGIEAHERRNYLMEIGQLSREVVSTMGDIVWSIDNHNDTLGALITRMRDFATEVLQVKSIDFEFLVRAVDENKTLDPALKQNIYLIFKESIHNIIKHAQACSVYVSLTNQGGEFIMVIKDDGCGFQGKSEKQGNGLRNMQRRAETIQGEFKILNQDGTNIIFKCKAL